MSFLNSFRNWKMSSKIFHSLDVMVNRINWTKNDMKRIKNKEAKLIHRSIKTVKAHQIWSYNQMDCHLISSLTINLKAYKQAKTYQLLNMIGPHHRSSSLSLINRPHHDHHLTNHQKNKQKTRKTLIDTEYKLENLSTYINLLWIILKDDNFLSLFPYHLTLFQTSIFVHWSYIWLKRLSIISNYLWIVIIKCELIAIRQTCAFLYLSFLSSLALSFVSY